MGNKKSSKSLRNSSSNSLISSLNSLIPDGISLTHIALAVVLGLIVCSFLNGPRVVEGKDDTAKPTPAKKKNKVINEINTWELINDPPKEDHGICEAHNTSDARECNEYKEVDDCNGDEDNRCQWIDCGKQSNNDNDSVWNKFNINLNGKDHDNIVKCLGNSPILPKEEDTPWNTKHILLPISGAADKPIKENFKDKTNFLHNVRCTYNNAKVDCKESHLPPSVIKNVESIGQSCVGNWNQDFKKIYKDKNGGGPIMSFNRNDGLQCNNPLMKDIKISSSVPRLLKSKYCGSGKCPCKTDTDFVYDADTTILNNIAQVLTDNTTSAACHNISHADTHKYHCVSTNVSNYIGGLFHKAIETLGSTFAITGDCS